MERCKNPIISELTQSFRERSYSLSNIKLPKELRKCCVWCLKPLKGALRRWCGDECVKEALTWGRPQSAHGLYVLLERQKYACAGCGISYCQYFEEAIPLKSVYRNDELKSFQIESLIRKLKRVIPREIRPEVDHVLAIVLGGTALGLENHQVLCAKCHKPKTKKDIQEKFAKNGNPRKGVKFTEEHVHALSKARKGFDSIARYEHREKDIYSKKRQPIIATNIKDKEELKFKSIEEASKSLNLQISNISRVLRKDQKRKQHKGWTFRYDTAIVVNDENSGQNEVNSDIPVVSGRPSDVSE